jgi:hypothetical protein
LIELLIENGCPNFFKELQNEGLDGKGHSIGFTEVQQKVNSAASLIFI